MLINPRDKSVTIGWDDVKKNWETVFNFWSELNVTQAEGPYVRVDGNAAWSTGVANVKGKPKTGSPVNAPTFEIDVFQQQGGEWQLVRTPPPVYLSNSPLLPWILSETF